MLIGIVAWELKLHINQANNHSTIESIDYFPRPKLSIYHSIFQIFFTSVKNFKLFYVKKKI